MSRLSLGEMRNYLSRSLSSINRNKINGLLAEVALRRHLESCGFGGRITPGGWLARSCARTGSPFGSKTIAFFPETVEPDREYQVGRVLGDPPLGLHSVCASFHQLGIESYFLSPVIDAVGTAAGLRWMCKQLGIPESRPFSTFPDCISGFAVRRNRYQYLRYKTDASAIYDEHVPDEFSKEHARVSFGTRLLSEIVDIDGLFWGRSKTYTIEIKEKTIAPEVMTGPYFGLDVGPFVKLAFFSARRRDFDSLFIVREIADTETRQHVEWWFIDYGRLAECAAWLPRSGGRNMRGGSSTVVMVPKSAFRRLDRGAIESM